MVERQFFHAQVVFGCNFLRNHQVVAGLGFARVGHGGGAHLEVALGRGQLFRHCGFLGLHEGQRVLRGQHIKVGLAHAHQQVLGGRVQLRLGHVHAALALFHGDAVGGAVQRLRCVHAQGLGVGGALHVGAGAADVGLCARHPRGEGGAGAQPGLGLVGTAGGGFQLSAGGLPRGVISAGRFHQLHEALRVHGRTQQGAQGGAERQGQVSGPKSGHEGPQSVCTKGVKTAGTRAKPSVAGHCGVDFCRPGIDAP